MFGRRPQVTSVRGVVATAHPLASQAGARMLLAGGNAFDAIVAAAAALNVVEPYLSGLAGMGMATFYSAREGRVRTLDFVTRNPRNVRSLKLTRPELSVGPKGIGTPGNLAGWCALLDQYGVTSRAEAFRPALELARDGFPLTEGGAHLIAGQLEKLRAFPALGAIFTDDGAAPSPGWVLRQPDLARTYEAVIADGPAHLYAGPLGRAMTAHIQQLGGCLNMDDLAAVTPQWLDPLAVAYRDLSVHTLPPPCEGFQMLLSLRILDGLDLARLTPNGVDYLDTLIRAVRLAAELRIRFNHAPPEVIHDLLAEDHVTRLRERLRAPAPITGRTEQWGDPLPPGTLPPATREHTTSLSAADGQGNLVCVTQSLGGGFGSGVTIPGHGVVMNDFLYWGDYNPASPNFMYPNGPLALPMAPTISTRRGAPVLALGTPGSYGILQTQLQAMVQHVDVGLDLQAAIEAPRVRVLDGATVVVEDRIPAATIEQLRGRGHDASAGEAYTMLVGGMQGATRNPATGALSAAADPRRDGYAIGI